MTDAPKDDVVIQDETPKADSVSTEAAPASDYSQEELTQLTQALSAVVLGAGMSEKSGAFGLMREIIAAMRASAIYVGDSSNPLLKQIVSDTNPSEVDAAEKEAGETPATAQKAVEIGIEAAKTSYTLLLSKGKVGDADAWAQLLLTAANAAVQATKSGGFLGIGGEKVTASEQAYMQQLADTLGYKKDATA